MTKSDTEVFEPNAAEDYYEELPGWQQASMFEKLEFEGLQYFPACSRAIFSHLKGTFTLTSQNLLGLRCFHLICAFPVEARRHLTRSGLSRLSYDNFNPSLPYETDDLGTSHPFAFSPTTNQIGVHGQKFYASFDKLQPHSVPPSDVNGS